MQHGDSALFAADFLLNSYTCTQVNLTGGPRRTAVNQEEEGWQVGRQVVAVAILHNHDDMLL